MRELWTKRGKALRAAWQADPKRIPWNHYPRPQLVREGWQNLNGNWTLGHQGETQHRVIRVPFCMESRLSEVGENPFLDGRFFYRRSFKLQLPRQDKRILLHFGAVDQTCRVYVNGRYAGNHAGGYWAFEMDITDFLYMDPELDNEIFVAVEDTLSHDWPWGKQSLSRGGMWYTPVSGIWQTVWLEAVPAVYVKRLILSQEGDSVTVRVEQGSAPRILGGEETPPENGFVTVDAFPGRSFPLEDGQVTIPVPNARYWTPESPAIYPFTVYYGTDRVRSYFALRTLSVEKIGDYQRLCLNGKPYYFHGLLDQGYYSDGLYTPSSPLEMRDDIQTAKACGFNTLRKHIKIEPEQFYYLCDTLGMAIWQDMVNLGDYHYLQDTVMPTFGFRTAKDKNRVSKKRKEIFRHFMQETVEQLRNHPCICLWTIYNEGWGQSDADEMQAALKDLDSTRFIDQASGWFAQEEAELDSRHVYFRKIKAQPGDKPLILSEYGGYVWKVREHSAVPEKTYGYHTCATKEALAKDLKELMGKDVAAAAANGLCADIYTQLSDVEEETNGLLTYDRKVLKVDPEDLAPIGRLLQESIR